MRNIHLLSEVASKQAGVISRAQVLDLGIKPSAIDRALRTGLLVRPFERVYRLASAPLTRDAKLWAALHYGGEAAVLSHESAGWLWRLEGLGIAPSEVIDVSVLNPRRRVPQANVRLHRTRVLRKVKDFATLRGFPCTSLARTLIDLASVLPAVDLEHAYDSAWRKSPENRHAVKDALDRLGTSGRLGAGALWMIANYNELGCTQSWLELKVRQAMRRAKIPLPLPQYAIRNSRNEFIGIFDFAWPEHAVVVFADGWSVHANREAFEKDRRQISALGAAHWHPLLVTHRRLADDEAGFIRELRDALHITESL